MTYLVGTSGWQYDHWRGLFYPADLPKSRWLDFYSQTFSTVELNSTFYRLPSEQAFLNWKEAVPKGFVYSLKVSRYITHVKKLRNAADPVENVTSRARLLGDRLGPLLYQTPPNMKRNDAVLEEFLSFLPKDMRHVFEFRNESWMDEGVFKLLRRYNAGFCIYDMPDFTTPVISTADFAYVRFHGSGELYAGSYSDADLKAWAHRLAGLGAKTVYAYFNNDAEGYALENALTLRRLVG